MKQIKNKKLTKILIIGSSGFIGKSLADYLCNKRSNISEIHTISRKKFTVKKNNKIYLKKITKNIFNLDKIPEVDFIIYLIRSDKISNSLIYFNKFANLISKFKKKPKILYVSSGVIYGSLKKGLKVNEKKKISIKNINNFSGYKKKYAKEKLFMEEKFRKLSKKGYKISIARCFTFVGKGILKYNYAIADIINSIRYKKKIILKNSHNVFRSYMHSKDMCRWLIKILKNSNNKCSIYNVGSEHQISLSKLGMILAKKYNNEIDLKKNKVNRIDYYVPSITLAKKELKLKITINLLDAINSVIVLK